MRVFLIDDGKEQGVELPRALVQAGHEVTAIPAAAHTDIEERITQQKPELLMIKLYEARPSLMELLYSLLQTTPLPIVMFVKRSDPEMTNVAVTAGVSAYIIDGLDSERLQPVMELAMARFNKCQSLHGELKQLKTQLAERKLIERAKGIVMQQSGMTEEQAFVAIRTRAMKQNLRLAEVAQAIITAADLLGGYS